MKKFLLLILLHFIPLSAWWDGGHLTVAQIAYDQLRPEVKEQVDALCASLKPFYPQLANFVTLSIWADEIKENKRFPLFDRMHYIDLPYDPEHILSSKDHKVILETIAENNVVYLIEKARATLQNKRANSFEKALMLSLLIHCVGDIHQPVHCCNLYTKTFPKGDMGGNLYTLKGKYPNLHLLWDAGAGAFPEGRFLKKPFDVTPLAQKLSQKYGQKQFSKTLSPAKWAEESHKLAIEVAYKIKKGSTPTEDYLEQVREISRKRATIAGYRLAAILNSLKL